MPFQFPGPSSLTQFLNSYLKTFAVFQNSDYLASCPNAAFAKANVGMFYFLVLQGIFGRGQLIFGLGSQQQSDRSGRCPSRAGGRQTQ